MKENQGSAVGGLWPPRLTETLGEHARATLMHCLHCNRFWGATLGRQHLQACSAYLPARPGSSCRHGLHSCQQGPAAAAPRGHIVRTCQMCAPTSRSTRRFPTRPGSAPQEWGYDPEQGAQHRCHHAAPGRPQRRSCTPRWDVQPATCSSNVSLARHAAPESARWRLLRRTRWASQPR